ncbi:flavin-containing monooxygenase [Flavilitoribacter nigricans]|uniref:Dimethylaniline monooxygenase n=1 Tax=Flavilitoribacter nigricans (strain ATCC 23147 / DSM 23189 / NBRC 102662 / NCIMB 1420 / SS-2) TaxID=1122177 RepID=A0A2D0N2C1_FLAN2|nr:FAD-dependent oxidoreductase [Flavilitoribacter nigricans]PHN02538.1 dimethylaniline monooxygenase [Flavilitoribacter nigricans DSM 23189 = NBRC 102662]
MNTATDQAAPTAAIIGAGPAGLVAARWLREVGFRITLIEEDIEVGGQWRVGGPQSSVWPGMRTNTSRVMTAFSDLPHPPGTPVYPTAEQMGAYLRRYAEQSGILTDARFRNRVDEVDPDPAGSGWRVRATTVEGRSWEERFDHVVAATGRYRVPTIPPLAGLSGFNGIGGVIHAAAYRGAEAYRGQRVLVAGHSISALEIASELALRGAARVVVAARRHRYVLQKILAGVPIEHRVYTRYAALASARRSPAESAAALKSLILRTSGHPAQFGAPCASEDPYEAGFTQNQFYLALVAEDRITPRPWMAGVTDQTVRFTDGSTEDIDTIIFATGYELSLPYLGSRARAALAPDVDQADLYHHTFHPDLPGFALVGVYHQSGPYFPTLELQARWVAYTWGGRRPLPESTEMAAHIAALRPRNGPPPMLRMHTWARLLADRAGVEPVPAHWPELTRALHFGPQSPASFRLDGPDALSDAAQRVLEDAAAFGAIPDGTLTVAERAQLDALTARGDH